MRRRRFRFQGWAEPLGLFLWALLIRLIYLMQVRHCPLVQVPLVDAETYVEAARSILAGKGLGAEAYWQPPLYSYWLAFWYALTGGDLGVIRVVQCGVGALGCVLIYYIGARAFNRWVGVAGALITSLYGPLLCFDGMLLPASLAVVFDLVLVWVLLRAMEGPTVARWLLVGAVLGGAGITVPTVLILLPVVGVWLVLHRGSRWSRSASGKSRLAWLGALWIGCAGVVGIVTARNVLVARDPVLISWNAGLNFYLGNNPDMQRTIHIRPGEAWRRLGSMPLQEGVPWGGAHSRYFFRKAGAYVVGHPLHYVGLLARKLAVFWRGDEIRRNLDLYYLRRTSWLLAIVMWKYGLAFPFGLLGPLALVGLVLSWRHPGAQALRLFALSYMTGVVLFFVTARYRLPVVPVLALFAAYAVQWGIRGWVRVVRAGLPRPYTASAQPVGVAIGATVLLLLGANVHSGSMQMEGDADTHYMLGLAYRAQGMPTWAIGALRTSVARDPSRVDARAELASLYAEQGYAGRSIAEYERVVQEAPAWMEMQYSLGTMYVKAGALQKARAVYQGILEEDSTSVEACYGLGLVYSREGNSAEAVRFYRCALKGDPTRWAVRYNLAFAYGMIGEYDQASALYRELAQQAAASTSKPEQMDVRNGLGAAYLLQGRTEEAISVFRDILRDDPKDIRGRRSLMRAYERSKQYNAALAQVDTLFTLTPDDGRLYGMRARLYMHMGDQARSDAALKRYHAYRREQEIRRAVKAWAQDTFEQLMGGPRDQP